MKSDEICVDHGAFVGYVDASRIPGVIVRDEQAYGEAGGQLYPVIGAVVRNGRLVPILDVPMADEIPGRNTILSDREVTA